MSWDSYITGPSGLMNRGPIEKAGIFGINGVAWAQHQINPTAQEIAVLTSLFKDPSSGYSQGFSLGGQRFALIRLDDDEILHGKGKIQAAPGDKSGNNPITVHKTKSALVIAIGKEEANGGQISIAVSSIGDFLVKAGY